MAVILELVFGATFLLAMILTNETWPWDHDRRHPAVVARWDDRKRRNCHCL